MSTKKAAQPDVPESFEAALGRLAEIVEEMENAELPLDAVLARYEEGRKLRAFCEAKLKEAEKRVAKIQPGPDGAPVVSDLDPPENGEAEPPAKPVKGRKRAADAEEESGAGGELLL